MELQIAHDGCVQICFHCLYNAESGVGVVCFPNISWIQEKREILITPDILHTYNLHNFEILKELIT